MSSSVDSARPVLRLTSAIALVVVPRVLSAQSTPNGAPLESSSTQSYALAAPTTASSRGAGAPVTITIEGGARRMFVGATVPHTARVRDAGGAERRDVRVQWTSSDPSVASVNQFGVMTAVRPGPVTVRVVAGSLSAERKYVVEANLVKSLTLSITADQVKTGDVVEVSAMAFDGNGYKVPNVPYLYTFTAAVEDSAAGQRAPAELDQRGRFVAQVAGDYQIIAVAPGLVAHRTVRVTNRDIAATPRVVARAPMPGSQVSDMFAWHSRDGRDFAIACGGASRGQVISYEVLDGSLRALDTVAVDGPSVADCSVDAETGIAAVVRDGGNGRSSIVLFDANDPRALKPLGATDDGLGAVSGIAIYKRHLFAVSDARRLDVVNIDDPSRPRRAGSLDLGERTSGSAAPATDVSVTDGIAYVALGRLGMAIVDVGGGKAGGSPAKPVRVAAFHAPFTSTHAAYGYHSRTGKWYVITSEDVGPTNDARQAASMSAAQPGFARIIDVTDPAHPEDVARYEVPEAGVQDLWIDGERLYVAAQTGGVRVVDIAADLKGNLYYQGREVGRFTPTDAGSAMPNVTAVQPVRGMVLAADRTSGLWMLTLSSKESP
jgi:hypothetical protein